jgi:predicted ABC-type ATPase
MVAGPNGSGKTTLVLNLFPEVLRINPDEIALRLRGSGRKIAEPDWVAMQLADRRRHRLFAERKSFLTESVFSHPSKLDLMREARNCGFEVWFVFVCLEDPLLNVRRVAQRAVSGGHNVPTDRIIQRYHRSLKLASQATSIADRSWFYDNSSDRTPHRLIARHDSSWILETLDFQSQWLNLIIRDSRDQPANSD